MTQEEKQWFNILYRPRVQDEHRLQRILLKDLKLW